jgi:hypothetical protein
MDQLALFRGGEAHPLLATREASAAHRIDAAGPARQDLNAPPETLPGPPASVATRRRQAAGAVAKYTAQASGFRTPLYRKMQKYCIAG